jgi:hypothetical protein
MSDDHLLREYRKNNEQIGSATRWGDSVAVAYEARDLIEEEMRRRRVEILRAQRRPLPPFVVDDPGAASITIQPDDPGPRLHVLPAFEGVHKARSEWRPARLLVTLAAGFALLCLAAAAAVTYQRVVELEASYRLQAFV